MIYKRTRGGDSAVDSYLDDSKSLPPKPMIYDGLYTQRSKVFDFDGPIPGVAAPYLCSGGDDE